MNSFVHICYTQGDKSFGKWKQITVITKDHSKTFDEFSKNWIEN